MVLACKAREVTLSNNRAILFVRSFKPAPDQAANWRSTDQVEALCKQVAAGSGFEVHLYDESALYGSSGDALVEMQKSNNIVALRHIGSHCILAHIQTATPIPVRVQFPFDLCVPVYE